MGGLAVAWQVNVTLSPSRTERGSMDRVTIGGSRKNAYWMFKWMEIDSARQHDDWFHAQKSHQNYKFHHKSDVLRPHFSTALCAKTELVLHLLLLHFFPPVGKVHQSSWSKIQTTACLWTLIAYFCKDMTEILLNAKGFCFFFSDVEKNQLIALL